MLEADLTAVAQRRQLEAPRLVHLLSGDLDWIVMKSLEKDRTRRYETANGLAMDIQRYLGNEPVMARPPSTLYRFQKLVRRNKTMFATAGVGLAALIIGLILSLYLFVQEKSALKRAVEAEQKEKQLREQAEQGAEQGHEIAKAELLLMAGKYDEAEKLIRDVPPHASMVALYNVFGGVHARRGQWQEALTNWNLVVQYAPGDHMGYMYLAPLLLQMENVDGYKQCRTQILQHFGDTSDPRIAERMTTASLLLPPTADELAVIARMAGVAGKGEVNGDNWGYNLFAMGFTEYRLGHFNRAAELLEQAIPHDAGSPCRTEGYLVLAMARYQLGHAKQSHDSLTNAVDVITRYRPKAGHQDEEWYEWIAVNTLTKEAVALIPGADALTAAAFPEKSAWQVALAKCGFKYTTEQQDDGTWEVGLDDQPVTDISMLRGAPLSRVTLMHTSVADLSPLRGMSLRWLRLAGTKVTDLSPLQGMPLESLQISGTPVTDISALRGMPLKMLNMTSCAGITNLEPIQGINTLQTVILPPNAKDFGFFRNEPQLTRISFKYDHAVGGPAQTATEFWAQQDAKNAAAKP
jgi:tetratricopeptide (TPR) repeat protein